MSKIEKTLENEIHRNPEKTYQVLIVTEEGIDVHQLDFKPSGKLMDNIFSAELKGSKIMDLSKHKSIQSIEQDEEMSIT